MLVVTRLRTGVALLTVGLTGCESTADLIVRASTASSGVSTTGDAGSSTTATSDVERPVPAPTGETPAETGNETGEPPEASTGGTADDEPPQCEGPQVRITELDLGTDVIDDGNQSDTAPLPLAIAPIPSGGSRLAWLGTDERVHIAELDGNDELVGSPSSLPAADLIDIVADDRGGVIALARPSTAGGTLGCGDPAQLCNPPLEPIPCYDMVMVRFDATGDEVWATTVTTASADAPPYSTPAGPNHFVWWYQHHGRLATDGSQVALYFSDAVSRSLNGCVDIFQSDRMRVVDEQGTIVDHPDAFSVGCSQSWNGRIAYDGRAGEFVMVCATDNQSRVARPAPYRTVVPATDLPSLSIGDLVLAPQGGYWASVSDAGMLRLVHFTESTAELEVPIIEADDSHLTAFDGDDLLVSWASGEGLEAQVREGTDGTAIGASFTVAVPDHRYQAFKSFPDGSAAFAARGSTSQSARIARVTPCP